jgi:hypothetical protein
VISSSIDVDDPTGCLDVEATKKRIEAEIVEHRVPEDASIAVVGAAVTSTTQVSLRVVSPRGEVVFDRAFSREPTARARRIERGVPTYRRWARALKRCRER